MRRLVIIAVVLILGCTFFMIWQRNRPFPIATVPATSVRDAAKNLGIKDVRAIFIQATSDRLFVTAEKNPRPFPDQMKGDQIVKVEAGAIKDGLDSLKVAVWPEQMPTNRVYLVALVLRSGETVGPFGFSVESPEHAFGEKFAKWFNQYSPHIKVKMK